MSFKLKFWLARMHSEKRSFKSACNKLCQQKFEASKRKVSISNFRDIPICLILDRNLKTAGAK